MWVACRWRRRRSSHESLGTRWRGHPALSRGWWRGSPIVPSSIDGAKARSKVSSERIRTRVSIANLSTTPPVPVVVPEWDSSMRTPRSTSTAFGRFDV